MIETNESDTKLEPKRVYFANSAGQENHFVEIAGYLIPAEVSDRIVLSSEYANGQRFESKRQLRYYIMLKRLQSNASKISNFKSSIYYKYYLKRLKAEHPEYLV